MSSTKFASIAIASAISTAPFVSAFAPEFTKPKNVLHQVSSTELQYRSLYHGPDVEPPSDAEMSPDFTKMDKDKIHRYGPGDFAQYVDHHSSDLFDGGDSEMGLSGDGSLGLHKIGRDVSPHMARTLAAKTDQAAVASWTYADELSHNNPGMDSVRAQQLENWATQQEIAMSNRYMNEQGQYNQGQEYYVPEYEYGDIYEDEASFTHSGEAGDDVEGIITLSAPINGVAAREIMLKNPYMGYARFNAAFLGDASNEWSVTPSDGFLKQTEPTHFVVRYTPHSSGANHAYLVIETEDFKKTWKVVGSTGESEF